MNSRTLMFCTGATQANADRFVGPLSAAMAFYSIDTPIRQAMFLANVGHESGHLVYTTEIWGPTPAQLRYQGREDLGNVHPGDGYKFRGRGLLQTTGRFNYVAVCSRLRKRFPGVPDFTIEPEKLAEPQWASLSACDYVAMRDLNAVADTGDFDGYCDIINRGRKTQAEGDSNGWNDRIRIYASARLALGIA